MAVVAAVAPARQPMAAQAVLAVHMVAAVVVVAQGTALRRLSAALAEQAAQV